MIQTPAPLFAPARLARPLIVAAVSALCGCTHWSPTILPDRPAEALPKAPGNAQPLPPVAAAPSAAASDADGGKPATRSTGTNRLFQTPPMPAAERNATSAPAPSVSGGAEQESAVALDQMPLPLFIETVYTTILKKNLSMDPAIAQRKELVSLKSGKPLSATALSQTARGVLKSYGLTVTEFDGLVRITPTNGNTGYLPELMRGRSLPDVPASLRPIFFLAEMSSVSPTNVSSWLRTLFGQRVNVQEDVARQAVLLSGSSDDIAAALEAIDVLDQPMMRGRVSARVAPLFWSADELAKRLSEVLQAQGYNVGTSAGAQAPLVLLPIGPLNSVIVFAADDGVLNHALRWATELDQPASGRGTAGYFTYPVRNMDAADLAKTLQDVMNPAGATNNANAVRSRVVVNAPTNTLIIQGNPTEYQQWFGLLQELDRPARTALISVTIAEVRLTNTEQMGFDWLLRQFTVGGFNVNLRNKTGQSDTAGNFVATIKSNGSSTNALLNALAATNKARILANPSVMARNGEQASIQVGQDVPIITQQQQGVGSTSTVPGGVAQQNILQTIQYRNTGVILKVKPVIHAGGRIDVDVDQEVSTVLKTSVGVTSTPTIQNRKLSTKLSVSDGTTVLLGGLMQEENKLDDSGVPWLKDIPLAGHLFKNSTDTRDRTELVILITPYVISNEFEAQAITEAFRNQFRWDSTGSGQKLRTPQEQAAPQAPVDGSLSNDPNQIPAKPYVLPAPDVKQQPLSERQKPRQSVVRKQQNPPDFPLEPSVTSPGAAASNNVAGQGSAIGAPTGKNKLGDGKTVEDPQILKELMDALNKKR
ncbi:secretin N-terminal domain-containing protein [Pelomonas sp. BJYL3]|uniref:secretin N-terminal domain-containing protein n=1 Tax=Pelomonas sp. BJYL3 TaxID=2976697 RepID=UPI0022B4E01D|nr:secretin N-terminal domain-containing protein [Pelomonas sp. BJYL3]